MNPDETTPPVDDLIAALQQHHWPVAVGLVIAFAIYTANRANLLKKVPSKYTPLVAAVLGIVSAIGAQLATGMGWEEAIGKGFLAGAAATGFWEMALKHFLKFPVEAPVLEPDLVPTAELTVAPSTDLPISPVKKPRAKAKAAAKSAEAESTAALPAESPAAESAPAPNEVAAPKKRGRPRKNPEA